MHLNHFTTIFLLAAGILLAGCTSPNVKYSDLRPPTTATISGNTIAVHVGYDFMNSACFTRLKARVAGQTVSLAGHRTLWKQSRTLVIHLPASVPSPSVTVVWIDPDGRRIPVPMTK